VNFPPEVERWRPLVAKYFPPELVDKALWVIMYESGGNPGAVGDGGNAIGLFQIHHGGSIPGRPDAGRLSDPEYNIRYAAQALGAARGNWAPWGENNTYNGKPFGALGHHPFPGDGIPTPRSTAATRASGAVNSLLSTLFGAGLREMQNRPVIGNPGTRGAFGRTVVFGPPDVPGGGSTSNQESGPTSKEGKRWLERYNSYLSAIRELEKRLAELPSTEYGARNVVEQELKYYRSELAKHLSKRPADVPESLVAPAPPPSKPKSGSTNQAGGNPPGGLFATLFNLVTNSSKPKSPEPSYTLFNPSNADQYHLLLWQIEQSLGPYVDRFRKLAPWISVGTLLATPKGLPENVEYITEPPVSPTTGKPINDGWKGPGIYYMTSNGRSVVQVMNEAEAQTYYRMLRDYAKVVNTFGPYYGSDKEIDPATAWANSAEVIAWQDAADRATYNQALAQAAEQLADREAMHWSDTWEKGGQQQKDRDAMIFQAGIGRMMPVMMNSFIAPPRDQRIGYWKEFLQSIAPPPPPRPVPPAGLFGSPSGTPKLPGLPTYEDLQRRYSPEGLWGGGPPPSVPF
jgi:hypothetical protein